MAKIRTKEKINWGGWNPFLKNRIEIEMIEISKSAEQVVFKITDKVIGEKIFKDDQDNDVISEYVLLENPRKIFIVPIDLYNQLYLGVEQFIPANLTPFEKEQLRPKLAFLFYFQNDKIYDESQNEFCLYGTQPEDWDIC